MLKKPIFFLLSLFFISTLYANPSPLGLELNKATLDDVKKNYKIKGSFQNDNEGYECYELGVKSIPIDTLSRAVVVSNNNKTVESVVLLLDKNKFDEFHKTLSGKYKMLSSKIPFVGDKYVKLEDGDCHITIEAPHMLHKMIVTYISKTLENKNQTRINKEELAKKEQTKELL